MLILTRRHLEELILTTSSGEQIRLIVKKLSASRVQLAIDSPDTVRVVRGEIAEQEDDRA